MQQVNSQHPQAPPNPVIQELPHLVVEEPKRGIAGTLGVVVLSLMLLGIPIGIYLVSQRTQLEPQAAVTEKLPEVVSGIFLESKLSLESQGGIIPVDVYVKSPVDQVNLINAQISFDPALVIIDKVATESAELSQRSPFNKWLEASFDNTKGNISIISGVPNPGIRTGDTAGEKVYLATLHLKPQALGTAILQVTPESQILRNSDNINIFKTGNDLALSLTNKIREATSSAAPASANSETGEEPVIVITSPVTAANYSYFRPVNINWSSFNVETITQINLYVNNELHGPVAENLDARDAQYSWNPKDSIALPYIQLTNTFRIELVGVSSESVYSKTLESNELR